MAKDGTPYTGFLYAGLMIDASGAPKVLEFNCRMGDPETQPIMMRLKSDLRRPGRAALDGRLDQAEPEWDRRAALGVVLAAHGYPDAPARGRPHRGAARARGPTATCSTPARALEGRRRGRRAAGACCA